MLAPFALRPALPDPGGGSSRPRLLRGLRPDLRPSTGNGPAPHSTWLDEHGRDRRTVPTFTKQSISQGGAQLYSGSIATATPQTFTMASPPLELDGFGVDHTPANISGHVVTHCAPAHIRQVGAGFAVTELPPLIHSRCTFWPRHADLHRLAVPAHPALVGAACHPPRRSPDQAAPRLHQAAATAQPAGSLTLPRSTRRLVAHSSTAKKADADFKISFARRSTATSRLSDLICAVRMVLETKSEYPTEFTAITSIARKLGIGSSETLRKWVRRAEIDAGQRPGLTTEESENAHAVPSGTRQDVP